MTHDPLPIGTLLLYTGGAYTGPRGRECRRLIMMITDHSRVTCDVPAYDVITVYDNIGAWSFGQLTALSLSSAAMSWKIISRGMET